MKRVFVVQKQMRWDESRGELVPKFDLSSAQQYGEVVYLLTPTASPFNPEPIVEELGQKLADFGDGDSLLLVGNPCLIGWATALAAASNEGRVRLLQWSGRHREYIPVEADLAARRT
jgi:hypothetical protein